jgi:hypothetical protein
VVEVITTQKFKSLNGYTYDKLADAERADEEWREENEYDLERDIRILTHTGEREMKVMRYNESQRKYSRFPELFVLECKHENQNFIAMNVEAVPQVYFEILKFNKEWGFYWTPAAKALSDEIIRTENRLAAIAFVKDRVDHQYENVYISNVTICEG